MSIQLQQPTLSGITLLRKVRDLPGPGSLPLLGNALQMDTQKLHLIMEEWAQQYGPIYKVKIGSQAGVVISDPELNNQILRARSNTYRRMGTIAPVLQEIGAHGVFSAEGEEWRQQRKLAT
jgi:cytochrome P450